MKTQKTMTILLLVLLTVGTSLFAQAEKEKEQKFAFDAEKKIELDLILGYCQIQPSKDAKTHLTVRYTYPDKDFQVEIRERGPAVTIEEKYLRNDPKGYADWFLAVPKGTEIEFNSATGGLDINDVSIEIEASSGTGNMTIEGSSGDFEISTGTGRIEVSSSTGEFELSSGTGRITIDKTNGELEASTGTGKVIASQITIENSAELSSGTGSVELAAPQGEDFDVTLSSGTGNATLDMQGMPLKGYYEFSTNARHGKIVCPVKFDGEEYYNGDESGSVRKWFQREGEYPRYYIETGTGKASLKK